MKVVLFNDYGGFAIPREVFQKMLELGYKPTNSEHTDYQIKLKDNGNDGFWNHVNSDCDRENKYLLEATEYYIFKYEGEHVCLKIVEVRNKNYGINDYDGMERII